MKLAILRHGGTEWALSGRYTGTTDVPPTPTSHRQAASLAPLVKRVLSGQNALAFSSSRRRATAMAGLALSNWHVTVDPLVAEYDYGDYEGLTHDQILVRATGWDIWGDGCPHGESTEAVGAWAEACLDTHVETCTELVVVTTGTSPQILAARALGLAAENGRLFASITASISVIEDYHGERCIGRWNIDAALLADGGNRNPSHHDMCATQPPREDRLWQSTR